MPFGWSDLCVWLVVVLIVLPRIFSSVGGVGFLLGSFPLYGFPPSGWGLFLTESLILAQDERWRRALHMQVER